MRVMKMGKKSDGTLGNFETVIDFPKVIFLFIPGFSYLPHPMEALFNVYLLYCRVMMQKYLILISLVRVNLS